MANKLPLLCVLAFLGLGLSPVVGTASADHVDPDHVIPQIEMESDCQLIYDCVKQVLDRLPCGNVLACDELVVGLVPTDVQNAELVYNVVVAYGGLVVWAGAFTLNTADVVAEGQWDNARAEAVNGLDETWCAAYDAINGSCESWIWPFAALLAGASTSSSSGEVTDVRICDGNVNAEDCSYWAVGALPAELPNTYDHYKPVADIAYSVFDYGRWQVQGVDRDVESTYDYAYERSMFFHDDVIRTYCYVATGDPTCGGGDGTEAVFALLV